MTTATATATPSPSKNRKSQGRGRSNSLPTSVVDYLKNWLMSPEHINHPYPSEAEKARMVADTGIDIKRLNNWFVNNRIRFWKPRYEAMQKQLKQGKQITKTFKSKENPKPSETTCVSPPTQRATTALPPLSVTSFKEKTRSEDVTRCDHLVVQALKLFEPRLGLTNSLSTAINDISATVSDDDSCSSSSHLSSKIAKRSSSNLYMTKTSMFRRYRKRQRTEFEDDRFGNIPFAEGSSRSKFTCNDVEQWKIACSSSFSSSPDLDDTNLPSLDDAVYLFGYSAISSN
mmetsp:Transcript_519/g.1067  ORF Transcript_519/g.1067 Transcript_519/m.1067 type:complete len:287 (-) Transcript_519:380-1240(-)